MKKGRADAIFTKGKKGFCAKKAIAVILAVVLILGCLPATALAAEAAQTPVFSTDLSTEAVNYSVGAGASPLQVLAEVTDGGTLTYQWYSSTTGAAEGFAPIGSQTGTSYTPSTTEAGTIYYKVEATNTLEGFDSVTAASSVATVTVTAASQNHAPSRKSDVAATANAEVVAGNAYTLNLADIFEDEDDTDTLTYKVTIDEGSEQDADEDYSFIPEETGVYTLVFRAYDGSEYSADSYTVVLTATEGENHAPVRKTGVFETAESQITLGTAYTLDLSAVFEDEDDDALTYKVSINGAEVEEADASYSYTPDSAGTYVLVFTANDGAADSTDTYAVTLNVSTAASDTVPALSGGAYQIGNAEQFAWFRDLVNGTLKDGTPQNAAANAVLTADIDMATVCGATAGTEGAELSWEPIGSYSPSSPYTGDFNGNGKKLTNLYINHTAFDYAGLFGNNAGTIRNLTIESGTLQTSKRYFGAIAGYSTGRINNCLNKADIESSYIRAAGLVGYLGDGGVIASSANTGDVSTTSTSNASYLAGIAAYVGSATIENCYNTGEISSPRSYLGGIAAVILNGATPKIVNCYNAGNVVSTYASATALGGVISRSLNSSTWEESTIQNNYYLSTGLKNIGLPALGQGIETSALQFKAVESETEMYALAPDLGSAYQADSEPAINGGYPVLSWQITGALFVGVSAAPALSEDLSTDPVSYTVGEAATPLSVTASSPDGGTLTYQWYKSATLPNAGEPIEGATGASYTPATTEAERVYYYVVITNQSGENDPQSITSSAAIVTVGTPVQSGIPALSDGVYQIENGVQLAWFRDLVNGTGMTADPGADAILLDDIDMSAVCGAAAGLQGTKLNWKPIGSRTAPYTGDFNGNGKKLTNLYIYNPLGTYQALFGQNDGTIRNLTIESGTLQSSYISLAALAAVNTGNVYNCLNKASVTIENNNAGGLVASLDGGVVANSANMGDVTCIRTGSGQSVNLGGIASSSSGGTIINCYNTGDINAGQHSRAGGIAAILSSGSIMQNCYNTGTVTGLSDVGGIMGLVNNVTTWNGLLVNNNYCLENTASALLGTSGYTVADQQVKFVSQAELQDLAGALGDAYQADSEPALNSGYPVLSWQANGEQIPSVSARPEIETDLSTTTTYCLKDSTPDALSVTASVTDGGTLSYQWYASTSAINWGYAPMEGGTGASYTPPTTAAGTTWYYVLVSNRTGENEPATTRSEVATVVVTDPLTVKLDGQEMSGDRLQSIVENQYTGGLDAAKSVKKFEILSGTFTEPDYDYLFGTLVYSNTNTGVSVLFDEAADISGAFSSGINRQQNSKLFSLEIPGLTKIMALGQTGTDADTDKLPTLYAPDVTEIEASTNTGSFYKTNVATLYFPNLQTIGNYAFRNLSGLKNLVLPGEMPTVEETTSFYSSNSGKLTVWVPADKANAYINAEDGAPEDGMWYWCNVEAFPEGVTNLAGLAQWAVDQVPALDDIGPDDEEAVFLAREMVSALPLSFAEGDMADEVQKAYDSYARFRTVLVDDIEARIAALPDPADVKASDADEINGVWDDYTNFNTDFKPLISTDATARLSEVYSALSDVLFDWHMENGTPFVSTATDSDGIKHVFFGQTFEEFKYPSDFNTTGCIAVIGRGNFTADDFFGSYGYKYHASVVALDEVTIDGGTLSGSSYYLSSTVQYLELTTITRVETQALRTYNYSDDLYLILPNIVYLGGDAYYDSKITDKAAKYQPLMSKLEESGTILRADAPLMLPRLESGEKVFLGSPQPYVYLPSLENAGEDFFKDAADLTTVWLPSLAIIDGGAFADSGISELYLGETPPGVLNEGGLASAASERTVYVPDDAVQAYKDANDGNTLDNNWYGFEIAPVSTSGTVGALLNYYLAALPGSDEITADYTEWIGYLLDARDSLTAAQQETLDTAVLDAATAAAAAFESEAIAGVQSLIEQIGPADELTLDARADVTAAREAYDALSKVAQAAVSNREDLFAAEERIGELLIADLDSRIDEIPDEITPDDIDYIRGIYSDYLGLTDEERAQIDSADVEKLNAAVDAVVQIENDTIKADTIKQRINDLPAINEITLGDESNIENIRAAYDRANDRIKEYVGSEALATLEAAEARIIELKGTASGEKTVYVAIEKFTLGQGYVQAPVAVTITEDETPNVAALILSVIGEGKYKNTGSAADSFYLQAVRDDDRSEAVIPDYILQEIAGNETVGGRNTEDWLGEFDYTSMSGWMYTVNSVLPSYGASDYSYDALQDGDVIRWQYTVYGYGADLGFSSQAGSSKFREIADKDELTAEIAKVDASPERSTWLQNETYASAYAQAYEIIKSMLSTQDEVDACTAALKNTPATGDLGEVTVTVRDTAARRQALTTNIEEEMVFENLTGLGDYQQPFGEVIENVTVPVTAGMNARDAAIAALENEGYVVETASGAITGVGPLTTADRSATVTALKSGDAGDLSKWVLGLNGYAITSTESADDFLVRDGDELTLEYSVDGGYDVQCFPYAETHFTVDYSVDARLSGEGLLWDLYVPDGTEQLAFSITRTGPPSATEQYNRYHKMLISSDYLSYAAGQDIPVEEGQVVKLTVSNPSGAGGEAYTNINDQATGSGESRIIHLTVKYLMVPADLEAAINALPATAELDYELHNDTIVELTTQYNLYTQTEKDQLSADAVTKLLAASARMEEIDTEDNAAVQTLITLVHSYYGKITPENYEGYTEAVNTSIALYDAMNARQKSLFEETVYYAQMQSSKELLDLYASGKTDTIGIPTDYENDFLLEANAFNLDLGQPDDTYQAVFLDTPRIGEQGYHVPDRVQFEIKDPSIFEILEVPYTYVDNGLGAGGAEYDSVKYYLIPKKEGTTTFTCSFDGFSGQTPEMVVHVNNADESAVADLEDTLTNINSLSKTRKYDTWYYFEGETGAPFSFTVSGSDPVVNVYNYLEYNGTDAAATAYPVDADGNVTVLLKDGYNPIEVTATLGGQRVTQVYGIKGKVISYEISNVTVPGSTTFTEGDTVSLKLKGLSPAVYKMLRIYNPSSTQYWFETNLPRYAMLKSGGGQYEAGELQFELTGSGEVTLTSGHVFQDWFGSALYSETATGNAGEIAPQMQTLFSSIPDISFTVAENPNYSPSLVVPQITGGNTVQAGTTATISIPALDTEYLTTTYQDDSAMLSAFTVFETDIPGCEVQSAEVTSPDYIDTLKTIQFTVPEDTEPGVYSIYGGRVDMTYGISWWMKYTDCFVTEIADLTVTVTASEFQIAKDNAKDILDVYADPADYRTTQQAELATAIAAGKQAIEAAEDEDGIAQALAEAKSAIDGIKTDAELKEEEDLAAANTVMQTISWIGEVTLEKEDQIKAARTAYNALTADQKALVSNYAVLTAAEERLDELKDIVGGSDYAAYLETGAYLSGLGTPALGSVGGEWMIIGLARAGYDVPQTYYTEYYAGLVQDVAEADGVLSNTKYTEYSRVILALTAIGTDVTDVGGYNLLEKLADYDKVVFQGVNGPIWALIALDSYGYDIPDVGSVQTKTTRELLIGYILDSQLADGGWNLTATSSASDVDITAMALQALAPYYDANQEVQAAVDEAVTYLSSAQNADGGYSSWDTANSESVAQVIVALTSLDIDLRTDERFIKNGQNMIDALMTFYVDGGGFKHVLDGERNGMATEQAYYALAAYFRFVQNETSLYDMSDVTMLSDSQRAQDVIDLIDAIGLVTEESEEAITAARNAYDALSETQKSLVTNLSKLTTAEERLAQIHEDIAAAAEVDELIAAIGTVTLDSKAVINAAREAYDALTDAQRGRVTLYATLVSAETYYSQLAEEADQAEIDEAAAEGVEELISDIGRVTLDSKADIAAARAAYNTLTSTQKKLVSNYSILVAAETKYALLLAEEEEETIELDEVTVEEEEYEVDEEGFTTITIDGVEYRVDVPTASAMQLIEEVTENLDSDGQADINAVIMAYLAYEELTDDQKLFVANYGELADYMQTFAEENQNDEETGISVEGLDWYVQMDAVLQPMDGYAAKGIQEALGNNTLLMMCEISLYDIIANAAYEPGDPVTVRVPVPDMSGYDGVVIVHQKDDGTIEYLEATVDGGELVFTATSFSMYGVLGYTGKSPLELNEDANVSWILWMIIAIALAAFLAAVLILRKRKANMEKR